MKAVDRGDILRSVKGINANIFTILRHWDESLQHFDGNTDWLVLVERARRWFSSHIDGTFYSQYAPFVDAVSFYNEIWANSQTPAEWAERVKATEAAIFVWNTEYRPTFGHDIKLVIGEAAVGNWMPKTIGELAIGSDNIVGYHPYTAWGWDEPKTRWEHDWVNLSGLYDVMEKDWGIKPTWAFTEAGPFGNVIDGWRHSSVCGGDVNLYLQSIKDWLADVKTTPAFNEGRIIGFNLFTTGGGDKWKRYETRQPELDRLAELISQEWVIPNKPPEPEPPPCIDLDVGTRFHILRPRTLTVDQWTWVMDAMENGLDGLNSDGSKQPIGYEGWSHVDAMKAVKDAVEAGKTNSRLIILDGHEIGTGLDLQWFEDNCPFLIPYVVWRESAPEAYEIAVIVDDLPKHETLTYSTRPRTDITTLTIHHTVSPPSRTIESIARYHISADPSRNKDEWPGIGYHFVLDDVGGIFQTNWLETISYHSYRQNHYSVGIALQGDFTNEPPPQAQLDAARWLVQHLDVQLDGLEVKGHRDMPNQSTACPGRTYQEWIGYIIGD